MEGFGGVQVGVVPRGPAAPLEQLHALALPPANHLVHPLDAEGHVVEALAVFVQGLAPDAGLVVGLQQLHFQIAIVEERLLAPGLGGLAQVGGVGVLVDAYHLHRGHRHAQKGRVGLGALFNIVDQNAQLGTFRGFEQGIFIHTYNTPSCHRLYHLFRKAQPLFSFFVQEPKKQKKKRPPHRWKALELLVRIELTTGGCS